MARGRNRIKSMEMQRDNTRRTGCSQTAFMQEVKAPSDRIQTVEKGTLSTTSQYRKG